MIWKENRENAYCEITPAILSLKEQWEKKNYIDPKLYKEYNVKRGLRNEDGRGVLTGLTRVAEIQSYNVYMDAADREHIAPSRTSPALPRLRFPRALPPPGCAALPCSLAGWPPHSTSLQGMAPALPQPHAGTVGPLKPSHTPTVPALSSLRP